MAFSITRLARALERDTKSTLTPPVPPPPHGYNNAFVVSRPLLATFIATRKRQTHRTRHHVTVPLNSVTIKHCPTEFSEQATAMRSC